MARRLGRGVLVAVAIAGTAIVTTGCDPDTGAKAATDFGTWYADHPVPGFTVAGSSSENRLPFVGSATVHLVVDPAHANQDSLVNGLTEICAFEPDSTSTIAFAVSAGPVDLVSDCASPTEDAATWKAIAAIPGLERAVRAAAVGETVETVGTYVDAFAFTSRADAARAMTPIRLASRERDIAVSVGDHVVLTEAGNVSAKADTIVDDALNATSVPLDRIDATASGAESHVEVTVSGDEDDARRMRNLLLAPDPTRGAVLVVRAANGR